METGIVVELAKHGCLWREVPSVVHILHGSVLTGAGIVPAGIVVGIGGHSEETCLSPESVRLIEDVGAYLLGRALVDDIVGIRVVLQAGGNIYGLLLGDGLVPVVTILRLDIDMVAHRLGIGDVGVQGSGLGYAGVVLVDDGRVQERRHVIGVADVVVVSVHIVVRVVEVTHHGEGTAGKAEPLAEEEHRSGAHALVHARVVDEGVVDQVLVLELAVVCIAGGSLYGGSVGERNLGLEENRGVLGEVVIETESD